MSGSVGAAPRMTPSSRPARSLTTRELRALSWSCRAGSGSSSTSRYQSRSPTGASSSIAAQQQVPERPQHAALGLEDDVDGLERDARLGRDRGHRRRCVALPLEQRLGGFQDRRAGRGGLLAAARRVVPALGLDGIHQFIILRLISFHSTSNELRGALHVGHCSRRHPRQRPRNVGVGRDPLGRARRLHRRARGGGHRPAARVDGAAGGRARARAGVRDRRRRHRGGRDGRRGRALRRRAGDDRAGRRAGGGAGERQRPRRSTSRRSTSPTRRSTSCSAAKG